MPSRRPRRPDWHVGVTGSQLLADGQPSSSKGTGLMTEAMIGSVGALVILALVFASFLALLPLLIGGISVLATFLVVGGLTEVTGVSQIVEFLIALIGLGVAIDYSLLVVSRWREERAAGRDNAAAVAEAMNHAGRAVVFSGLTVAIGLLSMIVLPVPMLRSVGYGGVLVPLVSVIVSVTLLPVILATVGPRLDWPRLRTERRASRVFSAWARGVYRHRWLAALAGLGILAALMLPALSLHLGEPGSSAQADQRARARRTGHADRRRHSVRRTHPGRGADVLGFRWSGSGRGLGGRRGLARGAGCVRRGGAGDAGLPAGRHGDRDRDPGGREQRPGRAQTTIAGRWSSRCWGGRT